MILSPKKYLRKTNASPKQKAKVSTPIVKADAKCCFASAACTSITDKTGQFFTIELSLLIVLRLILFARMDPPDMTIVF